LPSTFFILTSKNLSPWRPLKINTLYKCKADKIMPMDLSILSGKALRGDNNWLKKARLKKLAPWHVSKFRDFNLISRFSDLLLGFRLTLK
jgi:hypothetical protein